MANANEDIFSVHIIGDTTEKAYPGDFTVKKRLSHRDQLAKDNRRRELLGGAPGVATERALSTSMILSELFVRVIKAPVWWVEANGGLDLDDDNVIGEVYDKAMKVEADAIEAKKKKAEVVQEKLRTEEAGKKAEDIKEVAEMAAAAAKLSQT